MNAILQEIISLAHPLHDEEGIGPLVTSLKDKKMVMIGEASHGTEEFYQWRQRITQELIMNHGFSFVAVEGDWPPCQEVNRFVTGGDGRDSQSALASFDRWPTWMWANTEFQWFVEWLKDWNTKNRDDVGVHGLDVYSFYESVDQVIRILKIIDPELAQEVETSYSCLSAYRHDEKSYAKSLFRLPEGCEKEITDVLKATLAANVGTEESKWLDVRQNAFIVKNAESYYRAMVFGPEDSWNVRDRHMMSTLQMLFEHYGPTAKGIVWEHNTHVGDYRATDMAIRGQVNIGGLAREIYGPENVGLVGFGSYSGSVTASYAWDGPTMRFDVPEGRHGSIEHACHLAVKSVGAPDYYMVFDPSVSKSALHQVMGHRAIGVVYDPEIEHRGNYVPTSLAARYDAFIFLDHTHALTALKVPVDLHKIPETWPYGNKQ